MLRAAVGEEGPNGDRQVFEEGVTLATTADAIAHSYDGKRTEIVIDPVTSRTIGFRMVALTAVDGMPANTVIYSTTTDQKVVEHLGDR